MAHRQLVGTMRNSHAVRLGLRHVKGLAREDADRLVTRRGRGYDSLRDLWLRTGLNRAAVEKLAEADAFRSLGLGRRDALWAARALDPLGAAERLPLFEGAGELQREAEVALPPMPLGEQVIADYQSLSFSLKAHPMSFLRRALDRRRVTRNHDLARLRSGARVTVAGLVLVRQRPGTAKGVVFETIEDETGVANIIVWPKVFEANRALVLGARCVMVTGRMQSQDGVIHVVAQRLEDLTPMMHEISASDLGTAALANADEVRRPVEDDPRSGGKRAGPALARLLTTVPEVRRDAATTETARALPGGRNFH